MSGLVRLSSCLLLCMAAGCGSEPIAASDSESETAESEEDARLAWVYQPPGCGHAYGVVHREHDAVVVGAIDGAPWIARIDEAGDVAWERQSMRTGAYFAIDDADAELVAVGRYEGNDGSHGIIDTYDEGGVGPSTFDNLGGPGTALYGVAVMESAYAVTGVLDGFDMLIGSISPSGGPLETWDAPSGVGLASSVGFGIRADEAGGVAVCGRASAGEGGRAWVGRFDQLGAQIWSALGPDPGIGAYSDCWGLALGPGGDVFVVDYGYPGAHVARHAADDGELLWEASEPSTGTQAIDIGGDGTIYVGGWSADPGADPFRSHEVGERSGWLAAFDPTGTLLWRVAAAMPLSINALRVHEDGFVTVVGDLEPDSECSRPWVGRFEL
jgi:hypothetical protein